MTLKSFYKDDVLGYVTPSNSIPWLYDIDALCVGDDSTLSSFVAKKERSDEDGEALAEDWAFSTAHTITLNDSSLSESNVQQVRSGRDISQDESFIRSFTVSLRHSILDDVLSADERKSLIRDGRPNAYKLTNDYIRNVTVLGVSLLLSEAPYYGVRSFQSCLSGMSGRWALVAYHAAVIVATPFVRSTAGVRPKTAISVSIVAGLPFTVAAAYFVRSETSVLLPVTAAVAGAAFMWMSSVQDTYVTSLGASCAAIADPWRGDVKSAAKHFIRVFSQYLLIMQSVAVLVGNFTASSVYIMSHDLRVANSASLGNHALLLLHTYSTLSFPNSVVTCITTSSCVARCV